MTTRDMTKMAVCVALLSIAAYISFPLPFTPGMVTAQTIVYNLIAFIMTPKAAVLTVLAYDLLGVCGVPVFVGGTAGLGKILGPTGGFIIAFIVMVGVLSYLKGTANSFRRYALLAVFVGMPISYIGGFISMYLVMGLGVQATLAGAVLPFIPGDVLKSLAGAYLAVKLNKVFAGGQRS